MTSPRYAAWTTDILECLAYCLGIIYSGTRMWKQPTLGTGRCLTTSASSSPTLQGRSRVIILGCDHLAVTDRQKLKAKSGGVTISVLGTYAMENEPTLVVGSSHTETHNRLQSPAFCRFQHQNARLLKAFPLQTMPILIASYPQIKRWSCLLHYVAPGWLASE